MAVDVDRDLAVQDQVEPGGASVLLGHDLARLEVDLLADLDDPMELLLVEAAEDRDRAEPIDQRFLGHGSLLRVIVGVAVARV